MLTEEILRSFNKKNVLVTGGTGLIGRQIVRILCDAGANVAIVSAVTPDLAMTLTIVSLADMESRESRMKSGSMLSSTIRRLPEFGWPSAASSAAGPRADPPMPSSRTFG